MAGENMKKKNWIISLIIFITAFRPTLGLGIFGFGSIGQNKPSILQINSLPATEKPMLLACQPKQVYAQNSINNNIFISRKIFTAYFASMAIISAICGLTYLLYKKHKPVKSFFDKYLRRIGLLEYPLETETTILVTDGQNNTMDSYEELTLADYKNPQKFFDAIDKNNSEFIKIAIEKGFKLEQEYDPTNNRISLLETFKNAKINMFDYALYSYCKSEDNKKKELLITIIQGMAKKELLDKSLIDKKNPIVPADNTSIKTEDQLKTNLDLIIDKQDREIIKLISQKIQKIEKQRQNQSLTEEEENEENSSDQEETCYE